MGSGILFRNPAVVRIGYCFEHIAILSFEEGHIAVAHKLYHGAAAPLKEDACRKILITIFASEAIHKQRSVAVVGQWHVVVAIDKSVAIDVTILNIARTVRAKSLSWARLYILLVFEQAQSLHASLHTIGVARNVLVGICRHILFPVLYIIARIGKVTAQRKVHIVVDSLLECKVAVGTIAHHAAYVAKGI